MNETFAIGEIIVGKDAVAWLAFLGVGVLHVLVFCWRACHEEAPA